MIENNLVSIIIPTHNRATLLKRAIDSVLNQTNQDWELIIIADACTDSTNEVITSYKLSEKIFPFFFSESLGGAEARNLGISKAKGKYVAFLDDDDVWLPTKLENQINFIKKQNVCLVSCQFKTIDGQSVFISHNSGKVTLNDLLFENVLGSFSFCLTEVAYLKDLRIDKNLKACQDWNLWIQILMTTGKDAFIYPDVLALYSNDLSRSRLTTQMRNAYRSHVQFYQSIWKQLKWNQKVYCLEFLKRLKTSERSNQTTLSKVFSEIKRIITSPMGIFKGLVFLFYHPRMRKLRKFISL